MENGVDRTEGGAARVAAPKSRRKLTVSAALKWAWSDELPKEPAAGAFLPPPASASAWASILRFGELGSIVDRQPNRFGCIPFDQGDWPHPDALRIAAAVEALADCTLDVPDGWHPMPEITEADRDLGDKAVRDALHKVVMPNPAGERVFRAAPASLVVRHAILGLVPDWRMDSAPVKRFELNASGQPRWFVRREVRTVIGTHADGSDRVEIVNTEVDGWSPRLRRPVAGAYRREYLDPDPVPVMVARAEYEVFRSAMALLAEDLAGALETVEIMPDDWPASPWSDSPGDGEVRRQPRILPDLRAAYADADASPKARKSGKSRRRARSKISA